MNVKKAHRLDFMMEEQTTGCFGGAGQVIFFSLLTLVVAGPVIIQVKVYIHLYFTYNLQFGFSD